MAGNDSERTLRRSYFREWRSHRNMTQAAVVRRLDELGTDLPKTEASLSRLENGKQPYSQPILEALAEIYETEPYNLIAVSPKVEQQVAEFVSRLDEQQRNKVLEYAKFVSSSDESTTG